MAYPNPWRSVPDACRAFLIEDTGVSIQETIARVLPKKYGRVVVELGIGSGHVLRDMAVKNPDVFFVGVDLYYKPLGQTAKRLLKSGVTNAKLVRFNAVHPTILFQRSSVDGVVINFPEPWPKHRHHRHRILYGKVAQHFRRILKPGGWVFLQTDYRPYYLSAKLLLEMGGFCITEETFPYVMDESCRSAFHNMFCAQKLNIYRLTATIENIDA